MSTYPAIRAAKPGDLPALVETISLAFHDDPTWSWAFPSPDRQAREYPAFWRLMIAGALRHGWVWMTEGCEAAAVWVPPGETELRPEDEAKLAALLEELVGERAGEVLELIDRFEQAHPDDEPHYYLSLLGTHPGHAGHGLGMALLAENLGRIDLEGMPAYLESSNPANNHRYARLGFRETGVFYPPGSNVPVTTMWRPGRAQLSSSGGGP